MATQHPSAGSPGRKKASLPPKPKRRSTLRDTRVLLQQLIASMTVFDDSLAPVIAKYPWMFPAQHLGMQMPKKWLPAFNALCDDISWLLHNQRHGFHWRQLGVSVGEPVWVWRFDDDVEMLLATVLRDLPGGLVYQQPASDPQSDVFQTIQEWVHNARQLALEQGRVGKAPGRKSP